MEIPRNVLAVAKMGSDVNMRYAMSAALIVGGKTHNTISATDGHKLLIVTWPAKTSCGGEKFLVGKESIARVCRLSSKQSPVEMTRTGNKITLTASTSELTVSVQEKKEVEGAFPPTNGIIPAYSIVTPKKGTAVCIGITPRLMIDLLTAIEAACPSTEVGITMMVPTDLNEPIRFDKACPDGKTAVAALMPRRLS